MHGDQVLVELAPHARDGRAEGRIVRVMERAHPTVVGTFHYGPRHNYVRPIDERSSRKSSFPRHRAADASGSRRARRRTRATQSSRASRRKLDRVIGDEASHRRLGRPRRPGRRCRDHRLAHRRPRTRAGASSKSSATRTTSAWTSRSSSASTTCRTTSPGRVIEEAQPSPPLIPAPNCAAAATFARCPSSPSTAKPPATSTTPSWSARCPTDNYELQVHIADVAHYVRPGSPSTWKPAPRHQRLLPRPRRSHAAHRTLHRPLLPAPAARPPGALLHHGDRPARRNRSATQLSEGVIRSRRAHDLHRRQCSSSMAMPALAPAYAPLVDNFELMRELALILNRKRAAPRLHRLRPARAGHRVRRERPDEGHHPLRAQHRHRLIEEFMLAANETVATYLEQQARRLALPHPREARPQARLRL